MDCPVHKVPFGAPLNRGYTGDPPSRSVTFANTERHAEQRGSSHRPERISDCEDPPRSPVSLLGCGLVISSVTPYSDWLRAFDPTCPLVIAGPGPVGALA
jgi:hypothetical protein